MDEKNIFLEQVLSIDPISDHFDPDAIPSNGMEYLQKVHYEANMCEQVVVADIDVKKFEKQRTANFPSHPEIHIKVEFLPSPEWQEERMGDFSKVRSIVEKRRAMQSNHEIRQCFVPLIESEEGWYKFCVGDFKCTGDGVGDTGDDTDIEIKEVAEKLDEESISDPKSSSCLEHKQPLLHLLSAMSQVTIIAVLEYHVDWIENNRTDFRHSGPWLYALLACLEIPLIPEICSTIRSLARLAGEHRLKLVSPDDELLSTLNLIICLVGRYFRQYDLADRH